tara:strand:+ start:2008 stop:2178 length:171 start_codon:yes stop_codon:yes gene_type:complete
MGDLSLEFHMPPQLIEFLYQHFLDHLKGEVLDKDLEDAAACATSFVLHLCEEAGWF